MDTFYIITAIAFGMLLWRIEKLRDDIKDTQYEIGKLGQKMFPEEYKADD